MDEHYVLLNSNIINRNINNQIISKEQIWEKNGIQIRVIGKYTLPPNISFIMVTMLSFTEHNASTEYIEESLKKQNIKLLKNKNKIKKLASKKL